MTKLLIGVLGSIGLVVSAASGDTVRLRNGDVLSGKVTAYTTESLKLETSYAGTLSIAGGEVASVETAEPVVVKLSGGAEATGVLVVGEDGAMRLRRDVGADTGGEVAIDLASVSFAPPKPPKPWFRYKGEFNAGFNAASGNTETQGYHIDGAIEPVFGKNTLSIEGQVNRSEAEVATQQRDVNGNAIVVDETTASNWRVALQYDRGLTGPWYLFLNNGWENDDLKDLNVRISTAVGVGYKVWDDDVRFLSVEVGPGFIHENFRRVSSPTGVVTNPDRDYATGRWALDLDHGLFGTSTRFYHNHILIDRVNKLEGFLLQSATGLKLPLMASLNAAAEVQFDWNNDPAEGAGEDDLRYLLKLGYTF